MAARHSTRAQPPAPCKFCAIARGEEKTSAVYSDETSVAFLDYRPLILGHLLLVPRLHYPTLADVPDEAIGALAIDAKLLSAAVMQAFGAEGSFVALNNIVSQSLPHVHVHIVPRNKGDGLFASGFIWKRVAYRDDAEREATAARIRAALAEIRG